LFPWSDHDSEQVWDGEDAPCAATRRLISRFIESDTPQHGSDEEQQAD
jgi:hypothetical protein